MRLWFFGGFAVMISGSIAVLPAAEPRDPFNQGGSVYVPEPPEPPPCRVTLQYDCIGLPHGEANRMLREEFPAPAAAGALRDRLKQMIQAGTARRVVMDGLLVQHMGHLEAQTHLPAPGERDSMLKIEETLPGGGQGNGVILPVITKSAVRYEAGPKFSATAWASPDRRLVDLEMAWSWHGFGGNLIWGRTKGQISKGVWQSMEFDSQLRVPRDEWQLCALLCPSAAGEQAVMSPLPAERWMLFVRACPDQPVGAPVEDSMDFRQGFKQARKTGGNLVEWMVMEADGAADLMAAHSGVKSDRALRQALQRRLGNEGAQLLDTAWIAFSETASAEPGTPKLKSGYRLEVPEDDLPFNVQQDRSDRHISDGPGAPLRWRQARTGPVITIQNSFWNEAAKVLESSLELEWNALSGFREQGTPPGRMDAHFASIKQIVAVNHSSGEPRLAGKIPLPEAPVFGAPAVPARPRVILIFVTPVY